MKQPSQNLAKQIKAEEQKLTHLKSSVQASQSEWQKLKKQIANDTKVTIESSKKAIAGAVQDSKKELAELQKTIEVANSNAIKITNQNDKAKSAITNEIDALKREKKVLIQTNIGLNKSNIELNSAIKVAESELDSLKTKEAEATERINDLDNTEAGLKTTLKKLEKQVDDATNELQSLEQEYDANKAQFDKEISILTLKKQDLEQEIIENRSRQEEVRDNLATWQTKLDEKDKNLRIREARVNEQEKSIARNYNLLNM